jgi:hypothetical protein
MRYLVRAKLKAGRREALLRVIGERRLGRGSVAGGEYLRNMVAARIGSDGVVKWVEVCFCPVPLAEERPYWEEYFVLERVQDAHHRRQCRDLSGEEPWGCETCDCSRRLEASLAAKGQPFLESLRGAARPASDG